MQEKFSNEALDWGQRGAGGLSWVRTGTSGRQNWPWLHCGGEGVDVWAIPIANVYYQSQAISKY